MVFTEQEYSCEICLFVVKYHNTSVKIKTIKNIKIVLNPILAIMPLGHSHE